MSASSHKVKLFRKRNSIYADCQGCGWTGEDRLTEQEALDDAKRHEANSKPQMGGESPVLTDDPLVVFLYLLLRDNIHPGDIEQRMLDLEGLEELPTILTNKYLAGYAENLATRLRKIGAP